MTTPISHVGAPSTRDRDKANPLRELQLRLIAFKSLSMPLQLLTACTVIGVCGIGILLAVSRLLSAQIITNSTLDGHLIQTPLAVYAATIIASFLGWSCVSVASTRIPIVWRLTLCLVMAVVLGIGPVLNLYAVITRSSPAPANSLHSLHSEGLLSAAQILVLITLITWVGVFPVIDRQQPAYQPTRNARTFAKSVGMSILVGTYFIADILIVSVLDPALSPDRFIPSSVATQSTVLPSVLAVVVYWSSIDFIEWGETLAASVASVVSQRFPLWIFFTLVTLSALIFVADTIRRLGLIGLLPSLVTTSVVILVVFFLMRLVRVSSAWPVEVPVVALTAGAIFLFLFVQVALFIVLRLSAALHIPDSTINPFYTVLSVSLALAFFGLGLFLIARGKNTQPQARLDMATTGLFMAIIALLVIALSAPQLANVFGLPVLPAIQPNVADLKIIAGVAIVGVALWLGIRRRWTVQFVKPVTAAFMLLMGLQVIGWYFQLFLPSLYAVSNGSALIAAVIFIAAILWDLLTSGDQVTNQDSAAFPRSARVLLYLGYALVAATTYLYATSQHLVATNQAIPLPADGIPLAVIGAEGLGLPLLAYTFAQRIRQWRDSPEWKGER